MSRIGRLPVAIPAGVEVTVADGNVVTVKGPKGTLERALPTELEIKVEDGHVVVTRPNDLKRIKALHGLTRSLIHNMVVGVSVRLTVLVTELLSRARNLYLTSDILTR